jgi:hypothetical protein
MDPQPEAAAATTSLSGKPGAECHSPMVSRRPPDPGRPAPAGNASDARAGPGMGRMDRPGTMRAKCQADPDQ